MTDPSTRWPNSPKSSPPSPSAVRSNLRFSNPRTNVTPPLNSPGSPARPGLLPPVPYANATCEELYVVKMSYGLGERPATPYAPRAFR